MLHGPHPRSHSALLAGGRALLWTALAVWLGTATLLFARLGDMKAARIADDPDFARLALAAGERGWRVTHLLSTDAELNARVLRHWSRRAPMPGLREHVVPSAASADAEIDPAMQRHLVAGGWSFGAPAPTAPAQPRMEIRSPDGALAWSGTYRAEDLRLAGDAIWEKLAVARVIAGEVPPAYVPAGCAPPAGDIRDASIFTRSTDSGPLP